VFEWAKVTDSSGAFAAGDGYMFLEAVTVGGPGLVAVGGECPGSRDCIAGTPVDWTAAVWVSPDGFAWERVPHDEDIFGGPGSQVMLDVTPGGPGLVAVGFVDPSNFLRGRWHGLRNVGPLEDLDGAIWVSVDGIAWERVPDPTVAFSGEGDQIIHAVISTGSGLMAVGAAGGDAAVWVSPDGLAWSLLPQDTDVFGGNSNQWIHDVAVGGVGFVAVGVDWDDPESGGVPRSAVWTSVDGLAWTRATHDSAVFGGDEGDDGAGMDLMWTVTSTGNGVVASGWTYDYGEQAVWASPDGLTWQKAPDTYGLIAGTRSGPTKALVFHQGEVIGVGWDSGSTSISVDVPPHFEPNFTFDYVYPWTSMNDAVVFDGRVVAVGYDRFNGGVWHGGFGG
jgi:hypothetical protein